MRFYLFVMCLMGECLLTFHLHTSLVPATRLVESCCWDANRLPGHSWSPRVPLMFTMPRWPVDNLYLSDEKCETCGCFLW